MLFEYSNEKANKILDLLKDNKIATLAVNQVGNNNTYILEYTLIEEYKEKEQKAIRKTLENSLPVRVNIITILNQFIENKSLNLVNTFSLKFSAVAVKVCSFGYSYSFKSSSSIYCSNSYLTKEIMNHIEDCQVLIRRTGASDQKINCYTQVDGQGKRKKYRQLTLGEFCQILKESLKE